MSMSRVEEAARQTLEYVPGMLIGLAVLCLLYFAYFYGQTGGDDDTEQPAPAHSHSGQLHVVVPGDDDTDDSTESDESDESEADE